MTDRSRPDMIDRAAGLAPEHPLFALRAHRPEFLDGAEACRVSVLTPADDLGLDPALRAAIAHRVAHSSENLALIAQYLLPEDPVLRDLACGATPQDPRHRAIASHADMIAAHPGQATEDHLHALRAVGLTIPQVIALSELLAFVTFQIRVVHGLSLLKGDR